MADRALEYLDLDSFVGFRENPKDHDIGALIESIRRFGFVAPVLVDEKRNVVAGHGRLEALVKMREGKDLPKSGVAVDGERWMVPAVIVSSFESRDEELAYLLADNKVQELGGWHEKQLADLLEGLAKVGPLTGTGFDLDDLDNLLKDLGREKRPSNKKDLGDIKAAAERWEVQTGSIYEIESVTCHGRHRLMCGDSWEDLATAKRNALAVCGDRKAVLLCTDPPYLVDYTGERGGFGGTDWSEAYNEVDTELAPSFFGNILDVSMGVLAENAAMYIWIADKRILELGIELKRRDILLHHFVIWAKPRAIPTRTLWFFQHELAVLGWRRGHKPYVVPGEMIDSTLWRTEEDEQEFESEGQKRFHPTQKPLSLMERPIKKHMKPGELVFEPFSGSGTTIVAAERAGRLCAAIEKSPLFVGGTLDRLKDWGLVIRKVA